MSRPVSPHDVSETQGRATISRRRFLNGAASLAGGSAASSLLVGAGSAASPPGSQLAPPTPVGIPPYMTPVKDQDDPIPCNSCTAFAVIAAIEAAYNKKNGLPGTNGPDLDESDLFAKAGPKEQCSTTHWWPKGALTYCQMNGAKWESSTNPPLRIAPPTNLLDTAVAQTQRKMKDWIDTGGGLIVAIMVQYEDFFQWGDDWYRENGPVHRTDVYTVGKGRRRPPGRIVGGHAVTIVGYSGNDHWLCKNSWGSTWNGDGYVRIAQGKQNVGECYIDQIDVWGVAIA